MDIVAVGDRNSCGEFRQNGHTLPSANVLLTWPLGGKTIVTAAENIQLQRNLLEKERLKWLTLERKVTENPQSFNSDKEQRESHTLLRILQTRLVRATRAAHYLILLKSAHQCGPKERPRRRADRSLSVTSAVSTQLAKIWSDGSSKI